MKVSRERLAEIVGRFEGRRVAVLSDLVADEFVHGDIARVSREAPVLILEHTRTIVVPGGGGNAVANLRSLHASPIPVGVVGRDASGERILEHFEKIGVPTSGIRFERGYETPTKSRILAGGVHTRRQQVVRIDLGSRHGSLPRAALGAIRTRLDRATSRAEGLLIADYGYGAAVPELVRGAIPRGRTFPVTVDSRSRIFAFKSVTACTPNQEEVERALDLPPLDDRRALEDAGRAVLKRTGNEAILVTRGARGMSLFERGRTASHLPAFGSDEVADVTGAGDTVIAVFTLALLSGATPREAAILSNVAAGLVVMKFGTATVAPQEMLDALEEVETS